MYRIFCYLNITPIHPSLFCCILNSYKWLYDNEVYVSIEGFMTIDATIDANKPVWNHFLSIFEGPETICFPLEILKETPVVSILLDCYKNGAFQKTEDPALRRFKLELFQHNKTLKRHRNKLHSCFRFMSFCMKLIKGKHDELQKKLIIIKPENNVDHVEYQKTEESLLLAKKWWEQFVLQTNKFFLDEYDKTKQEDHENKLVNKMRKALSGEDMNTSISDAEAILKNYYAKINEKSKRLLGKILKELDEIK